MGPIAALAVNGHVLRVAIAATARRHDHRRGWQGLRRVDSLVRHGYWRERIDELVGRMRFGFDGYRNSTSEVREVRDWCGGTCTARGRGNANFPLSTFIALCNHTLMPNTSPDSGAHGSHQWISGSVLGCADPVQTNMNRGQGRPGNF